MYTRHLGCEYVRYSLILESLSMKFNWVYFFSTKNSGVNLMSCIIISIFKVKHVLNLILIALSTISFCCEITIYAQCSKCNHSKFICNFEKFLLAFSTFCEAFFIMCIFVVFAWTVRHLLQNHSVGTPSMQQQCAEGAAYFLFFAFLFYVLGM